MNNKKVFAFGRTNFILLTIGKLVDAFLADFEPFGCAENFAHMCGEVVVGVDDKFLHNVWGCFFVWAARLSCASAVF